MELADRRRDEGKEGESKVWGWVDGENGGGMRGEEEWRSFEVMAGWLPFKPMA